MTDLNQVKNIKSMTLVMLKIRWGKHKTRLFDTQNTQPVLLKDATVMKTITFISRTKPVCLQMVFELPDRDFMWRQEI